MPGPRSEFGRSKGRGASRHAAEPESSLVFAYGSNLDPERMGRRVPSALVVGCTQLSGYELRFHKRGWDDGTGKANAHHTGDPDSVVHGVVYQVCSDELAALDIHETGYERRAMDFALTHQEGHRTIEAWIYLALPEVIDDSLVPARWYRDHVLVGARAHSLPAGLVRWLERLPTDR